MLRDSLRSDRATLTAETPARLRSIRWASGPLLLFLLLWWETFTPFRPLFQSGWRKRALHGLRNITMALLNSGMTALLFVGLWAMVANWAEHNGFGLLNWTACRRFGTHSRRCWRWISGRIGGIA